MSSSPKADQLKLEDLRLFVAIIEAGSLSSASELLGTPISRLSRRLTALETTLGTILVNRGKKGIHLNELGETFFVHAKSVLAHAEFAMNSIQNNLKEPKGKIRLSLPTDVATLITPLLSDYLAKYPQIRLEISLNQHKINMIQDGVDIAIRAGTINNDNVIAKTLQNTECGTYASRQYLDKYGTPSHPNELNSHTLITQSLAVPWKFFYQNQSIVITPTPLVACNDFMMVKELLLNDLGIGVMPTDYAKNGHLVRILEDWQCPTAPLSIIYYKNRGSMGAIRSFVDWILDTYQPDNP